MEFDYKKPSLELLELISMAKRDPEYAEKLREFLIKDEILVMYEKLVKRGLIPENEDDIKYLKKANSEKIGFLEKKKKEDPENETLMADIDKSISEYYCQILDLENSNAFIKRVEKQNLSSSFRMDVFLCKIRMAIILKKKRVLDENIAAAKSLCEKGCDWDRRNKFKIYEAIYLLKKGFFKEAAPLFSESLATFESPEVCIYEKLALYAIFTGLVSFSRRDLKDRIISSSNILEIRNKIGIAYDLAVSLYSCEYSSLFRNLVYFIDLISEDIHLGRYKNLFCREIKLKAYKQLLISYKTLSIVSIGNIFGVSTEYVERDLVKYIVSDRLSCKIDKVDMTVFMVESKPNRVKEFLENGDEIMRMVKKKLK